MNRLVWTSVSKGMENSLLDWIMSLRKVSYYSGEVLILNYSMKESFLKSLASKYDLKIISIDLDEKHNEFKIDIERNLHIINEDDSVKLRSVFKKESLNSSTLKADMIVNYRYMDIIDILSNQYKDYVVVHFDSDVWFQDNIDNLFCLANSIEGCVHSPSFDNGEPFQNRFVDRTVLLMKDTILIENIKDKVHEIVETYQAHLNGGCLAGKTDSIIKRLTPFKKGILNRTWPNMRGANQTFLNYTFNQKIDLCEATGTYNAIPFKDPLLFKVPETGWLNPRTNPKTLNKVIHMLEKRFGFYSNNFFETFWESLNDPFKHTVDNSKHLIWTSVTEGMEFHLLEWIISLRKTAKYTGNLLILDYGLGDDILKLIEKYNVKVIKIEKRERPEAYFDFHENIHFQNSLFTDKFLNSYRLEKDLVVNYRYMDILPYLEGEYKDYLTVHFDVDMWFQTSIDDLFLEIPKAKRCLFSPANSNPWQVDQIKGVLSRISKGDNAEELINSVSISFIRIVYKLINDETLKHKFLSNLSVLYQEQGSFINGGFIAGTGANVFSFLKDFSDLVKKGALPNRRGSNQAYLNIAFNRDLDLINYWQYNVFSMKDKEASLDMKSGLILKGDQVCKGIHVGEFKEMSFKHNYFELFLKEFRSGF